ncbi:MAG: bifunctional 4-hydroxy-2-oxoglutarate aldolase/2-dehydro-3-deoxy-phosphogluconate aldolase [Marmoricola sp.]
MSVLDVSPVIPVVVLDDPDCAAPLARALVAGGVGIVEVTLRTPSALTCIERIAREVPEIVVGAGTVLTLAQTEAASTAGATFLVSPGTTDDLASAFLDSGLDALPGCSTISEALELRERGFRQLKFFPAEPAGGPAHLSAIRGPLPDLRFCPTGGITLERTPDYLALPNVPCVGGSWLTPSSAIAEHAWDVVTTRAAAAVAALRPVG